MAQCHGAHIWRVERRDKMMSLSQVYSRDTMHLSSRLGISSMLNDAEIKLQVSPEASPQPLSVSRWATASEFVWRAVR